MDVNVIVGVNMEKADAVGCCVVRPLAGSGPLLSHQFLVWARGLLMRRSLTPPVSNARDNLCAPELFA